MALAITEKINSTHKCVPPQNKNITEYIAYHNQYYRYDLNGSVTEVRDGPFEASPERTSPVVHDLGDKTYYTEGGWALNEPKAGGGSGGTAKTQKEYRWDDKNRLAYSNDGRYSVRYTYGEDGERTGKWAVSNMGGESETLYFGKLWGWHYDGAADNFNGMNSKHIFVGETRIATKVSYADGSFIAGAERQRQYYYHSDHLGSAQLVTDWQGQEYERFEYTPYGELWIEKAAASALDVPYRFTGKERDKETGLYYYGARYLDPRESRWLSVDPAMGEYVPSPGQEAGKLPGMGGVFNTVNLHVYHYAGNNPVKYVDPDGNVIRKVSDAIKQQDSIVRLGTGSTTIKDAGCVLTTVVRIANAIGNNNITLEDANRRANELDLYTNDDELTPEASAKLITDLTGVKVKSGVKQGTEAEIMGTIKNMDENPYEGFFVTGRIEAHSADGTKKYGHQVNVNEKGDGTTQPIVDTSSKNRTSTDGDSHGKEQLYKVYWFKTERE